MMFGFRIRNHPFAGLFPCLHLWILHLCKIAVLLRVQGMGMLSIISIVLLKEHIGTL